MAGINGWTNDMSGGNVQFVGKGPACAKCLSCGQYCQTGNEKTPYGCSASSNESAAAKCMANKTPTGCDHFTARGNKPMTTHVVYKPENTTAWKSFANEFGITADMKNLEREMNDSGLGLVVGVGKLAGKAASKAIAKEKAEQARKDAEEEILRQKKQAEVDAVTAGLKSIKFGKDSASVSDDLDGILEILSAYTYELDFPFGPKGPCMGAVDAYQKDIWKTAEKHMEKGLDQLRKIDPSRASEFAAKLKEEQDKVDPKVVKERLLAEKAEDRAQREEEKAQRKAENAEKLAAFKETAGGIFNAIKGGDAGGGAKNLTDSLAGKLGGLGGMFGKKDAGTDSDNTADGGAKNLTDSLAGKLGGLGGLFGKKK